MPRDDILASAISQDEAVEQANAFCDDGPPPPGDPGWGPSDDYGYDWDYGEPTLKRTGEVADRAQMRDP